MSTSFNLTPSTFICPLLPSIGNTSTYIHYVTWNKVLQSGLNAFSEIAYDLPRVLQVVTLDKFSGIVQGMLVSVHIIYISRLFRSFFLAARVHFYHDLFDCVSCFLASLPALPLLLFILCWLVCHICWSSFLNFSLDENPCNHSITLVALMSLDKLLSVTKVLMLSRKFQSMQMCFLIVKVLHISADQIRSDQCNYII